MDRIQVSRVMISVCTGMAIASQVYGANEVSVRSNNFSKAAKVESKSETKVENKAKPAATQAPLKPDAARAAQKKKIEEKKKDLNGSSWDVVLVGTGSNPEPGNEELLFQDGKVLFKKFAEKSGFKASNYTISIPEGSETAVWETMQTNDEGGLLFIRGEWKGEQMSGIISQQTPNEPEKPAKDYSFSTQKKRSIPTESKKLDSSKDAGRQESQGSALVSKESDLTAEALPSAPVDAGEER